MYQTLGCVSDKKGNLFFVKLFKSNFYNISMNSKLCMTSLIKSHVAAYHSHSYSYIFMHFLRLFQLLVLRHKNSNHIPLALDSQSRSSTVELQMLMMKLNFIGRIGWWYIHARNKGSCDNLINIYLTLS